MEENMKINILTHYPDLNLLNNIIFLIKNSFGDEHEKEFMDQLEYFKNENIKHYLSYIEEDGKVVSLIIGVQNFGCEYFLDLGWICTLENYRGNGLCKNLINEIGDIWIKNCPGKYPYLFISNYNNLIKFYEKLGFEKLFSHHSKAVIMTKKLFND